MEGIIYKQGHNIPTELIVNILENLGCKNIKGNDYNRKLEESISYFHNGANINGRHLIPDFTCTFNEESTVVEVGNLTEENKINLYLNKFKYVIHIFADKNYFLLHCVLYQRRENLSDKHKSFLENINKFIDNWLKKERENELFNWKR